LNLEVTDDSGFLAVIDPDAYQGFVASDWDLDALQLRFREQMAARRLLIWGTGQEGSWTVRVQLGPDTSQGFREVSGSIVSTKGRLLLTNYESLTMAAQYDDVRLPERHQADLVITVPPGAYRCRVVQHTEHDHGGQEGAPPDFTISLENTADLLPPWDNVPWSKDL